MEVDEHGYFVVIGGAKAGQGSSASASASSSASASASASTSALATSKGGVTKKKKIIKDRDGVYRRVDEAEYKELLRYGVPQHFLTGLSINASWATQENIVTGTERKFVQRCQDLYGPDVNAKTGLPECTQIWVDAIKAKNPSFVAIQEGIQNLPLLQQELPDYVFFTKTNILRGGTKINLHFMIHRDIQSGENPYAQQYSDVYTRSWEFKHRDRPIQILNNAKGHYVINLHAPHKLRRRDYEKNIAGALDEYMEKTNFEPAVKRITVFGDFNDKYFNLASKSQPGGISLGLEIANPRRKVVLRANKAVKSCCYPRSGNSLSYGDYIMDTEMAREMARFKREIGDSDEPQYSDHWGVWCVLPSDYIM